MDDALGKNGWGQGYTFPCLFKNADKGWILISETGVNGRYFGGRLMGGNGGLYTIGLPQEGEMNGLGSSTTHTNATRLMTAIHILSVQFWATLPMATDAYM